MIRIVFTTVFVAYSLVVANADETTGFPKDVIPKRGALVPEAIEK